MKRRCGQIPYAQKEIDLENKILEERKQKELESLEKDLQDLSDMFRELNDQVSNQGDVIQTISDSVDKSEVSVTEANIDLKEANKYSNKYKRLMGATVVIGGTCLTGGALGLSLLTIAKIGAGLGITVLVADQVKS